MEITAKMQEMLLTVPVLLGDVPDGADQEVLVGLLNAGLVRVFDDSGRMRWCLTRDGQSFVKDYRDVREFSEKKGIVRVSRNQLKYEDFRVTLFTKVIPLEMKYDVLRDMIEIIGESEEFVPVMKGQEILYYRMVKRDDGWQLTV